jgi:hypothetical protein
MPTPALKRNPTPRFQVFLSGIRRRGLVPTL